MSYLLERDQLGELLGAIRRRGFRLIGPVAHDQLAIACEQAIRGYDPCICRATHFLTLRLVSPGRKATPRIPGCTPDGSAIPGDAPESPGCGSGVRGRR